MSQKIRILLIDDHGLFRESLSRLLETIPGFQVAGSFASMEEARVGESGGTDNATADIALLDCDSKEEQATVLVEGVVQTGLAKRVLLVTAGMSDAATIRMLKCGVSGIFLKHDPPARLVEAIRRSMRGEIWLDNRGVRALVAGATAERVERLPMALTDRERAVLSHLFEGLTNKEIAGKLQISENAVKWALQQLFEKTGAKVRSQLVRIALEKYGKDWLENPSAGPRSGT